MTETATNDVTRDEAEIRALIDDYIDAVRSWNPDKFRETFHPDATVTHYHLRSDSVKTSTLAAFVQSIGSLHERFDNAEEVAKEVEVMLAGHIAAVRVDFDFVMGERIMSGQDIFNVARVGGRWVIIHKSYHL